MPSPETDLPTPTPAQSHATVMWRRWLWLLVGLIIVVPCLLTLAGALTSPPRARQLPIGRILFLEADQPSEHTSLLRGLRITLPQSGQSREILHETEPQDTDDGARDWVTQPLVSPDGRWLAYEKQMITIQEEKTGIVNQLWALPLDTPSAKPHLLLDLTARGLKQCIGLAWTPDSRHVVFLEDQLRFDVAAQGPPVLHSSPLPNLPPLRLGPQMSATRHPALSPPDTFALAVETPFGNQILLSAGERTAQMDYLHGPAPAWAVAPDGRLAAAPLTGPPRIEITPAVGSEQNALTLHPRWGWSVFGKRQITSLKWSPDGRFLGYTVSKPPFEDELFYADVATDRCFQLPIRTGLAAWDWTR